MRNLTTLHRVLVLIALSLLLLSATGCNKMLAKFTLDRAQKRRETAAQQHDAARFTKELLEQTDTAISKGNQELATGNFAQARETSKDASRLSSELLERSTVEQAKYLKEQALLWIKRAQVNQAQQEDANLFNQIQQNNEKGLQLIEKEKYDKSIVVFKKVNDDIQYLLKNLQTKAQKALADTKTMKDELVKEGAPENAPEYVEQMNDYIAQIDNDTNKEYNYRAALTTFAQAQQTKAEGIQKTKEVKSHKQLAEIEDLLETASNWGADVYAEQNFRNTTKSFEDLLTQFYEKKYDTVLAATPELKPKVVSLILETKRESARAKIHSVEQAISTLVDAKARTYLPGRVEQLESQLADAKRLFADAQSKEKQPGFNGDGYVDSQKVSERALKMNTSILQEFDALAQSENNKASEALAAAEGVYNTMRQIFDQKVPGTLTGEDKALEDSKQALKAELKAKLDNARVSLGIAALRRQEKNFNTAIETAKQVGATADYVTQQTYRVVAHNAILEIAHQLSGYESFGGRQYASAELNKTEELLEDSKKLLHGAHYRDAVRRAADTKAQLEVLNQEMERVAVSQIGKAQQAIGQARHDRAPQYQSRTYNQAISTLDQAKSALDGAAGLQQAIESARRAQELAARAQQQALKQWANEQMKRTDTLLQKAQQAGADAYAPEQLLKAQDLRKNLQQLYDQQHYRQAVEVGDQAAEAAHSALYAKVIAAENKIAAARRTDAFQYQPQRLAEAIVAAKNAREMMDQDQWRLGLQNAQNAIVTASNVAHASKREAFEAQMNTMTQHLQQAQREGAGYYQNHDLAQILSEMNHLRDQFNDKSYDDLSRRIEVLKSQLAGVVESTPDVLKDLATALQNRLQTYETRGASTELPEKVDEVKRKIKYAQLDFQHAQYRSSFTNALDASRTLDAIEQNLAEREFDAALSKQLRELSTQLQKFSPILSMGSPALVQMAVGHNGRAQAVSIMQGISPSDLRTAIAEIGGKVRLIPAPPTRAAVKEQTLQMLVLAKTAASNFEKMLIMDQYTQHDARDIIQTAFMQMYQARTAESDIMRALQYPTSDLQPAGVERVVSYQGE